MPIFQADLDNHNPEPEPEFIEPSPIHVPSSGLRRLSEESIRTELCEGLVPDSPPRSKSPQELEVVENAISDRASLIERLKRAQSPPTWVPNRHLESVFQHQTSDIESKHPQTPTEPSMLLAPAQITPEKNGSLSDCDSRVCDGLSIERPRSALHSGNFSEEEAVTKERTTPAARAHNGRYTVPAEPPWIATSPPRHYTPFQHDKGVPFPASAESFRSTNSPLSSSLSSSFAYKPPTSPLVQAQSSEEHDMSLPKDPFSFVGYVGTSHRTPQSTASSPWMSPSPRYSLPQRVSSYRREAFPYQAHQPRRSLTSTPSFMQPGASPPTPALLRPRRSSVAAEASPLQHASMVGSYEESILRGRMSTTPSKPLDFVAQIGVLGKGKCKSSLKCPPHVSLSFPAVYYSYSNTSHGRSNADDGPSPYVGQIDLENGLSNPDDEHRAKKKAQSRAERRPAEDIMDISLENQTSEHITRRNSRASRRSGSGSAKAPPGGSYRLPEKGQIQIIIKNPNKTAVKLFLVPYDLTGMEPGTKTFVRQRSYSAGPIIDNAPATSEANTDDRPILRYLAHLHICCPAKDRYYLYKSIRIVFANRVPDGKEKLRNETTWPEPRYTPYKPVRVMHPPLPTQSSPAAMLAVDKASRRRSVGFFQGSSHNLNIMDNMFRVDDSPSGGSAGGNTLPVDPIPFYIPAHARTSSDISNSTNTTIALGNDSRYPGEPSASRPSTKDSNNDQSVGPALYEKLNKGEPGYGGNAFALNRSGSLGGAEGLLSQRLRSLGVKQPSTPETPRQEDMSP
ncbi:hypothetical protein FPOAC2_09121 [Fusarium poae]|uniref:Atos-like conserved domain-containing protein n=1 Tax=Fusarium poae TaxID=36050 RepID=A0A1B8AN61_FUSPO|nr:hypothetical protein FPOAC1_009179 [Fusarium poae]KAG8669780.1 hypothetical protein FPOAC1_009179 [Fusarium poae]OBS21993.1 hypothetical protein FPOA_08330 [Fusarium poae]